MFHWPKQVTRARPTSREQELPSPVCSEVESQMLVNNSNAFRIVGMTSLRLQIKTIGAVANY